MIRIGVASSNGGPPAVVNSPRIITAQNLHFDKALATIIYKLIPGLYKREMANVQEFYQRHPTDALSMSPIATIGNSFEKVYFNKPDFGLSSVNPDEYIFLSADEPIR